jgi:hypothetical protein
MSDTIISVNNDAVENTHEKGTLKWDLPNTCQVERTPNYIQNNTNANNTKLKLILNGNFTMP